MGVLLDVACACALSFLLFLLAFMSFIKNTVLAALIALVACVCVGVIVFRLLKKKPRLTRRRKRLLSDKYVKSLCYMDCEKAHEEVMKLLSGKYPISDAVYANGCTRFTHAHSDSALLVVIQKLKASPDDLLSAWRTHGRASGVGDMVFAVPGRSEQDIRVTAMRLKSPNAIVLDRKQLRSLARKYAQLRDGDYKRRRPHPLRALSAFITRRRAGHYALYALILIFYYIITGGAIYLVASAALIAVAAMSLRRKSEPDRLI